MARTVELDRLVDSAVQGARGSVARLISLVENDAPGLREIAARLVPLAGRAEVIGLTGSPGVGKSTSTSALVHQLRAAGRSVGVLAVDPSSPFTGGALLGDRIRMQDHAEDDGVFVRSLASRGHLGGLSAAVPQALRVLDAAGFDVVLIETVGVGQAEIDIASLADTTLVLLAPGMGDGIQAAKAGILEVADVFVVNKADRPGADQLARELRQMQSYSERASSWRAPVVPTVAARSEGLDDVLAAVAEHRAWMQDSGELVRRRTGRAASEIEAIALERVRSRFDPDALHAAASRVVEGLADPFGAADDLLAT